MPIRILDLREEESCRFTKQNISDSEILALDSSRKFEVEAASLLNGNTYGIRSRGWVGHIPIGNELLVRVLPKVPVSNLFRMLEVAYDLKSFRILDGEIGIESIEDFYDRIVSILSRRILDRARKGLYRSYIGQHDNLPYVRGRINSVPSALNVFCGIPQIACDFEEHTADVDENRILSWALHQIRRQAVRKASVRRELDLARRALAGTVTLERHSVADCIARSYHRLNDDYRPMHGLCRFILDQTGPGIDGGDRSFVPFMLNMPKLFEAYVAEWLRKKSPSGITVKPQYSAVVKANYSLSIDIDIVLVDQTSNQAIAVLDTKYKSSELPSKEDIYQIAFYAQQLHVSRGILVYPSPLAQPFQIQHGVTVIESMVFDVGKGLDHSGAKFLDQLSQRLPEMTASVSAATVITI